MGEELRYVQMSRWSSMHNYKWMKWATFRLRIVSQFSWNTRLYSHNGDEMLICLSVLTQLLVARRSRYDWFGWWNEADNLVQKSNWDFPTCLVQIEVHHVLVVPWLHQSGEVIDCLWFFYRLWYVVSLSCVVLVCILAAENIFSGT